MTQEIYEFDKPHPGESLDAYMKRHRVHPEDDNPRKATPEEAASVDKTEHYEEHAFTITKK